MMAQKIYDCCIVGGGLAGLSLACQLSKQGLDVLICEQKQYPMHKVCGEYVSMESYDFLLRLGLPLNTMDLPVIKKLNISAPDGNMLSHPLDLGGFGISRYKLEHELAMLAVRNKAVLLENTKVFDVQYDNDLFQIKTNNGSYFSKVCIGSFGKNTSIGRTDEVAKNSGYIGVKYHIRTDLIQKNVIELHNFNDGYCGISMVEDGKACLCYLTTAANLKKNQNQIRDLERKVLMKNIFLKRIFETAEFLFEKPLTISNITFNSKKVIFNQILLVGDAAGSIAPLCGNGMSMAFRGANIASELIPEFLNDKISRETLNNSYEKLWRSNFSRRITIGAGLQKLFGADTLTNFTIGALKYMPSITRRLIKLTHGNPF